MPSDNTAPWPSEIRLNPARDVLTIAFEDGSRFELRAEMLRVESPSAEVRGHGGPKTIEQLASRLKHRGFQVTPRSARLMSPQHNLRLLPVACLWSLPETRQTIRVTSGRSDRSATRLRC